MSDILLAGLTEHEGAAIEVMISMAWPEHDTVHKPRSLSLSIPEQDAAARACNACVVDLFGLGLRRHSPDGAQQLLHFLKGRSAILLIWGDGGGWLEHDLPLLSRQEVEFLQVPYSNQDLRRALMRLLGRIKEKGGSHAPKVVTSASGGIPGRKDPDAELPAWRRALDYARQQAKRPLPDGLERQVGRAGATQTGLPEGRQAEVFLAFPELANLPRWALVSAILAADGPHVAAVDGEPVFILNQAAGWLASPRSPAYLMRLQNMSDLVHRLSMNAIPPERIEASVARYFDGSLEQFQWKLDDVLWELAADALRDVRPNLSRDLSLQLLRLPNFTRLTQLGPLDIQLAMICARVPQTAYSLLRIFQRQKQDAIRFLVLALSSGAVTVQSAMDAQTGTNTAPRISGKVESGFLKSFLKKLKIR